MTPDSKAAHPYLQRELRPSGSATPPLSDLMDAVVGWLDRHGEIGWLMLMAYGVYVADEDPGCIKF